MSASWAAVLVACCVAVFSLVGALLRIAWHDGRLEEILRRLTAMGADHEARIRDLEKTGGPH